MIISPRSDFGQKRPSPAGAMRLLFGASAIGAMPEDRAKIRKVKDFRVRVEQTPRRSDGGGRIPLKWLASEGPLMERRRAKAQHDAAVNEERMAWKALNDAETHQRAALHELWEQAAKRLTKISSKTARLDGKPKWWFLWRRP